MLFPSWAALAAPTAEGKTSSKWSDPTAQRVTWGVLWALRDFGVSNGVVNKKIAPASLPVQAFAYLT